MEKRREKSPVFSSDEGGVEEGGAAGVREEDSEERKRESSEVGEESSMMTSTKEGKSGRSWRTFPNDHHFLVSFRDYLTSRHGRSRSKNGANQITAEVSRFLYFAEPSYLQENLLLNAEVMDGGYLKALENAGTSPSTQNAKLCRLRPAIEYLSLRLDPKALPQVAKLKDVMKNWISVLEKEARRQNRISLEEASENPANLE